MSYFVCSGQAAAQHFTLLWLGNCSLFYIGLAVLPGGYSQIRTQFLVLVLFHLVLHLPFNTQYMQPYLSSVVVKALLRPVNTCCKVCVCIMATTCILRSFGVSGLHVLKN